MKTYRIEFVFTDDFDVDSEFKQMPYGMTLHLQIADYAKKIQPAFAQALKTKSGWVRDNPET